MPRHMSSSVNTFRYNLPYRGLFGGAIALTRKQFERVNGFSNVFYGWGGEDDDFYSRLQSRGFQVRSSVIQYITYITHIIVCDERFMHITYILIFLQITRFGPNVAQYYMLTHKKEPPSTARFANLENGARRYDTDGLNNLEYRVLNHQLRPLYSWILADV